MWVAVNHESLIKIGRGNGCNWTQAGTSHLQANPGPQGLSWGEDIHGPSQYLVIEDMWFPLCWRHMWWRNGKEREAEMLMCCRKRENGGCKESLLATWAMVMSGPSWSEGGSCVIPRTYSSQGLSLCLWLLLQPVVVWVLVSLPPRTCCCPKANPQLVSPYLKTLTTTSCQGVSWTRAEDGDYVWVCGPTRQLGSMFISGDPVGIKDLADAWGVSPW